jgi:hypothetical protein
VCLRGDHQVEFIVCMVCSGYGGSTRAITARTDYRVVVSGMAPSTSWQDLKVSTVQGCPVQ